MLALNFPSALLWPTPTALHSDWTLINSCLYLFSILSKTPSSPFFGPVGFDGGVRSRWDCENFPMLFVRLIKLFVLLMKLLGLWGWGCVRLGIGVCEGEGFVGE